jgi:hypothetical protein
MIQDLNATSGQSTSTPTLSFGQKLVGITFNPSNLDNVSKAKSLFAEAADLVEQEFRNREQSEIGGILYSATMSKILDAQMNVVKLLTLKY